MKCLGNSFGERLSSQDFACMNNLVVLLVQNIKPQCKVMKPQPHFLLATALCDKTEDVQKGNEKRDSH